MRQTKSYNQLVQHANSTTRKHCSTGKLLLTSLFTFFLISIRATTSCITLDTNSPRSIYQYSNMPPRLSGQTSKFGTSVLGIKRQKKLKKFTILTRKRRSHVRISIYGTKAEILDSLGVICEKKLAFKKCKISGWQKRSCADTYSS